MQIWAEVFSSGSMVGLVPLVAAQVSTKLDSIGEIKIQAAATHPRANDLLVSGREVRIQAGTDGTGTELGHRLVGAGLLLKKSLAIGSGELRVNWVGPDLLEYLRRVETGRGRVYNDTTFEYAIQNLVDDVDNWKPIIDSGVANVSTRFDGGSIYRALSALAYKKGLHVRAGLSPYRVEVGALGDVLPLRISNVERATKSLYLNPRHALVERLDLMSDSLDVVNWIEPLGGSGGDASLTIKRSTRTSPYTIQNVEGADGRTRYYLSDSSSISTYGTIQRVMTLQDIYPVETSYKGVLTAANMLYDWGASILQRRSVAQVSYKVSVKKLRKTVRPGDKVRLAYKGYVWQNDVRVDYVDIDSTFWVLEVTKRYTVDGVSVDLVLSNVDIATIQPEEILAAGVSTLRDGQVGVQLTTQTKMQETVVAVGPGVPGTVTVEFSPSTVELARAVVKITRVDFTGPDSLLVMVDNQVVDTSVGPPYLGGSAGGDTVEIDIEDYLTSGAVDIQETHTIQIASLYNSGDLTVRLEWTEVLSSVTYPLLNPRTPAFEYGTEYYGAEVALRGSGSYVRLAQAFVPDASVNVEYVGVYVKRYGKPIGDIQALLYNDTGNDTPRFLITGGASDAVYALGVIDDLVYLVFHFPDEPSITGGLTYHLVLDGEYPIDANNYVAWGVATITYGSDLTGSGTATASSETAGFEAPKAFDDSAGSWWASSAGPPNPTWLKYDFGAGQPERVNAYTITPNAAQPNRAPRTWELQGSHDDTNWKTLDTRTNETIWTGQRDYQFENLEAFRYYRLYMTANNGDALYQIQEVEFLALTSPTPPLENLAGAFNVGTVSSDITGSGTASASSETAGFEAGKAFDDNAASWWASTGGPPNPTWLKYDLGAGNAETVTAYSITPNASEPNRAPRDWILQGSNNDSDWTDLDTRTDEQAWTTKRTYTFTNATDYRYYRLYMTDNNGDSLYQIQEVELFTISWTGQDQDGIFKVLSAVV